MNKDNVVVDLNKGVELSKKDINAIKSAALKEIKNTPERTAFDLEKGTSKGFAFVRVNRVKRIGVNGLHCQVLRVEAVSEEDEE